LLLELQSKFTEVTWFDQVHTTSSLPAISYDDNLLVLLEMGLGMH